MYSAQNELNFHFINMTLKYCITQTALYLSSHPTALAEPLKQVF